MSVDLDPARSRHRPRLVLCATDDPLAAAWRAVTQAAEPITVHAGSILDVDADAVVSPANSLGWMRGGIDAVYARSFDGIEERVRRAVLTYHGGELPVGEALIVETGVARPQWLISAPTMRGPGEQLADETVHPFLAARAVFRLWSEGTLDDGTALRDVVQTIAMPGLGTGVGGVSPERCAHQVAAAWEETFTGGANVGSG